MEDHRLKSFCLVVETKSFSRAARAKRVTQSAMSHLIKNLEDELGVQLLRREGRDVTPTPTGRILYEHAKKILEGYARMGHDLSTSLRAIRGSLCVGASRTPASHLLPQVLYNFTKDHPDIEIDLVVSNTDSIVQGLRDERIDIGIVEGNISDNKIFAEAIAEDEVVIIAPEDHVLTKKKSITAQDLALQTFILPESGSGTRELIDDFFRNMGMDEKMIKVRMTLDSPELIVQMVQAGLGVAFASKWSVFTAVKEGMVIPLKLPNKKMKRNFCLISVDREPELVSAKMFKEFIKQYRFFVPF
jgi:LysR family transcriptional regulator, transcriptional activator of the cysJI operon